MKKLDYSNSQCLQDLFVICVLNGKRNGTYIEIGANRPVELSNTYLLETKLGWSGVSFEINHELVRQFNRVRRNTCICGDATAIDFNNLFRACGLASHIDYLQLDIEPAKNTFRAFENIDFDYYSFSVITYEHDLYSGGEKEREASREILAARGYTRTVSDILYDGHPFEDWYVNEKYMPNNDWRELVFENAEMKHGKVGAEILNRFTKLLRNIEF